MKPINLNRREKYAVGIGAGCLLVLLVFQLVVSPVIKKKASLEKEIEEKTVALGEIYDLKSEYLAIQKEADYARTTLAKRKSDFSLYTFLADLAADIDIKDNVERMNESSSTKENNVKVAMVSLKLKAITMEKATQYLHRIEYSGNNLFIRRMSISETSKPEGYIDVELQVETVVL